MIDDDGLLIVRAQEVEELLAGQEIEIIELMRSCYIAHAAGQTSLPHSTFLKFPDRPRDRIIALPAYLGPSPGIAGMKWIASFPDNISRGKERASAVCILNCMSTGRPQVVMEGSILSSRRTAASAALALNALHSEPDVTEVGLIGCGVINFEILRFTAALFAGLGRVRIYDTNPDRASRFRAEWLRLRPECDIRLVDSADAVLRGCSAVSFATTAASPHVGSLSQCKPGTTVLHISLRDLSAAAILSADNVVDDADHVCRAGTSPHLAEECSGNRDFIRCSLGEVLMGSAPGRGRSPVTVFSPFGLGILDVALGGFIHARAVAQCKGIRVDSFLPRTAVPPPATN